MNYIIIFILIDSGGSVTLKIVIVTKAKNPIKTVYRRETFFEISNNVALNKNEEKLEALNGLEELQANIKQKYVYEKKWVVPLCCTGWFGSNLK